MTLGADRGGILRLVLGQACRLALGGIVLGFLLSLAVTRLLASLLFEVSTTDPITLVGVVALLVIVTLLACSIPARRAIRVDPLVAMRNE
jgi:ABC-type antimicrobial peptide transport system permease subunit